MRRSAHLVSEAAEQPARLLLAFVFGHDNDVGGVVIVVAGDEWGSMERTWGICGRRRRCTPSAQRVATFLALTSGVCIACSDLGESRGADHAVQD